MPAPIEYQTANQTPPRSIRPAMTMFLISATLNIAATALLAWSAYQDLWHIPPGTSIRPMFLWTILLLGGLAAFLQSAVAALISLILGWRRKRIWPLAILLLLLGTAPLPTGIAVFHHIVTLHHLNLES